MNLEIILAYCSLLSVLLPLSFSFVKRVLKKEMALLRLLLIFSFLFDLTGYLLAMSGHNNLWLANLYYLFQFVFLLSIFRSVSGGSPLLFYIPAIAVGISFLLSFLWGQSKVYLDSNSAALTSLIMMFMSVRFFHQTLTKLPTEEIQKYPILWVVIAVFFYYSGTLLLFSVNNFLTVSEPSLHKAVWAFHNFLNITKNLLFAVALWRNLYKAN